MKPILKVVLFSIFFVIGTALIYLISRGISNNDLTHRLLLSFIYVLIVVLVMKFLYRKKIKNIKFGFKLIFLGFCVYTLTYYLFQKLNLINVSFDFSNTQMNIQYFILLPIHLVSFSILEELFYRKYMFLELKNFSKLFILIFSSILFSISHIPDNLIKFFLLFLGSLIFGYIYVKTKKIKYSIAAHIATNLSMLLYGVHEDPYFSNIVKTKSELNFFNGNLNTSAIIILISTIIIAYVFINYSNNISGRSDHPPENETVV